MPRHPTNPPNPGTAGTGTGHPSGPTAYPRLDPADTLTMLSDLHEAQAAVITLQGLLKCGTMDALDNTTGTGLSLLLEGARTRLELTAETLIEAAEVAGFDDLRRRFHVTPV